MKKFFILIVSALLFSFSSFAILPITGTLTACTGLWTSGLSDATPGGTWSSSNTAIATVGTSGVVHGVSAGITTITYTVSSSYVTASFTVSPATAPITGATSVCTGSTTALSDATTGGTWFCIGSAATISVTGVVTGTAAGTADITYSTAGGCNATTTVTVNSTSPDSITGSSSICLGTTSTLADASPGGAWSSSNTSIATIGATGIVTGVSVGAATISYAISSACGSGTVIKPITISGTTSAGTISGPSSVAVGASVTLTDGVAGGAWVSTSPSIATIETATGIVTGVAAGTAMITYSITGCSGLAAAPSSIVVTPFDGISGHVLFTGAPFSGDVKVWLITYNPSTLDLEAIDSVTVYCSGGSVYYKFTGIATDSFRIKAAVNDTAYSGTGYVPTYHSSYFYWHDANAIAHTSGTADINKDITMAYGTVTAGPGFIGGNVTTGANKGTSEGVAVAGLKMYLINPATNTVMQQTYTDGSGNYTFSSLPVGRTYSVFPESLTYSSIPYNGISLTTASYSMTSASFIEHTVSKTITPVGTGVTNFIPAIASVFTFPNPTIGKLNIAWNEPTNETGKVSITDITGREIYKNMLNMTEGSGVKQVDLSALMDGLYIITVKSGNINYTNKILLQH